MDSQYQPLYQQAAVLQHKFHDFTNANNAAHDPTAMVLRTQIHGLTNDLAQSKNPRSIENRMRIIQTQLRRNEILNPEIAGHSAILNVNQKNYMNNNFEKMRQNIRLHPHF